MPLRTPCALFLLRLLNKERKKGFDMRGISWHTCLSTLRSFFTRQSHSGEMAAEGEMTFAC